ncbi:MAG TPA: hypothetical protein VFQ80_04140, partial [Thermomicrobiales bacterium]|nr:hypothetical protein [Thermomicrobiales bacterium]
RRQGWPPRRRLQFAGALAALVIRQAGARSYPTAAAVLSFLAAAADDAACWKSSMDDAETERR